MCNKKGRSLNFDEEARQPNKAAFIMNEKRERERSILFFLLFFVGSYKLINIISHANY